MKESQDTSFKSGEVPIMNSTGTYLIGIQKGDTVLINNEYGEWVAHRKTVLFDGKQLSGALYHSDGRISHDSIKRQFILEGDTASLNYVWDPFPAHKVRPSDLIQPNTSDLTASLKTITYTPKPGNKDSEEKQYPGNEALGVATVEVGIFGLAFSLYNIYEYCKNIIVLMRM